MRIKQLKSILETAIDSVLLSLRPHGDARSTSAAIESLEDRRLLSTYVVTNTSDSGAGSLRQAILDANNHAGADKISFSIGTGARTISPSKALPGLGDGTTLDATTQPGYAGKPLVTLNGSGAGSANGLKITGGGCTIRGFVIKNFGIDGILIVGSGGNTVAGNYIGNDGSAAAGNKEHGILVQSPNNTIGGTKASDRNVISGNAVTGVFCYTLKAAHNHIEGNYIGTDATGGKAIANGRNGVQMESAADNTVGGIGAQFRNVISGNARDGIIFVNEGSRRNVAQGNYVGTNAAGTAKLGNGWYGIEVSRQDNVIGGSALGAGNVVSGNVYGGVVLFLSTSSGNRVQGNFIGTDYTGTKDLGNVGRGMEMTNGAHDNIVGGDRGSQKNVISGNDAGGVGIYSGSHDNQVMGNYIGLTADGSATLGNTGVGVMLTDQAGANNIIGGRRAGNIISGNGQGVVLSSGTGPTLVQGNYIGTDVTGTKDLGNATDGIYVGSSANQIGGRKSGTGNLISGNNGDGVRINKCHGNLVRRNIIGVSAAGSAMGNVKNGVLMMYVDDSPVRANTIAHNGENGVRVTSGNRDAIVLNSIYSNTQEGISLSTNVSGPTITSAQNSGTKTVIKGSVTGKASTKVYVELYSTTSSDTEGKTLLGTITVKTNASGKATFELDVDKLVAGTYVTATVTSADGATSEFAKAVKVS